MHPKYRRTESCPSPASFSPWFPHLQTVTLIPQTPPPYRPLPSRFQRPRQTSSSHVSPPHWSGVGLPKQASRCSRYLLHRPRPNRAMSRPMPPKAVVQLRDVALQRTNVPSAGRPRASPVGDGATRAVLRRGLDRRRRLVRVSSNAPRP